MRDSASDITDVNIDSKPMKNENFIYASYACFPYVLFYAYLGLRPISFYIRPISPTTLAIQKLHHSMYAPVPGLLPPFALSTTHQLL